jgi:hypothetical protein
LTYLDGIYQASITTSLCKSVPAGCTQTWPQGTKALADFADKAKQITHREAVNSCLMREVSLVKASLTATCSLLPSLCSNLFPSVGILFEDLGGLHASLCLRRPKSQCPMRNLAQKKTLIGTLKHTKQNAEQSLVTAFCASCNYVQLLRPNLCLIEHSFTWGQSAVVTGSQLLAHTP